MAIDYHEATVRVLLTERDPRVHGFPHDPVFPLVLLFVSGGTATMLYPGPGDDLDWRLVVDADNSGPQGEQGPQGDQGEQGPQGEPGADGADGIGDFTPTTPSRALNDTFTPHATGDFTPTTPSRALNDTFTPHATDPVLCIYTVEISCDAAEDSSVELRSDAASPPTTVRCSARLGTALLTPDVVSRQVLVYVVPPGHNVRLVTSGTASVVIVHQTEEQIGA